MSEQLEVTEFLEHFGVKGMRWGVRGAEARATSARAKADKAEAKAQNAESKYAKRVDRAERNKRRIDFLTSPTGIALVGIGVGAAATIIGARGRSSASAVPVKPSQLPFNIVTATYRIGSATGDAIDVTSRVLNER